MDLLQLVNRTKKILATDLAQNESDISKIVENSRFLVVGGAGTIGQAVVKEIFKRNPRILDVVDISENNLVELVRDLRSSLGYIDGQFRTFALDIGSKVFESFWLSNGNYDFVLNLSALKHVRSEKDSFTLMRMIEVNILNSLKLAELINQTGCNHYFCVSTDKAANPVNMMGASKRLMERFIIGGENKFDFTMARFANVAFSDGSLPAGFLQRIFKNQPISAPNDVKRYFISPQEAGELCLLAALLGKHNEIFFPRNMDEMQLTSFKDVALNFLDYHGLKAIECETEEEARALCQGGVPEKYWPCYFFKSDTTGEKSFEEFFTKTDDIDTVRFSELGIIKAETQGLTASDFAEFESVYESALLVGANKNELVKIFNKFLPEFRHDELGKYLDQRM
tara:strand:- start:1711 stop:2898 length:1188 start_codon:yes stop_codon:yes gene_type:complete